MESTKDKYRRPPESERSSSDSPYPCPLGCLTFHEEPVQVCAFPGGVAILFLHFFGNIHRQAHFIQWPLVSASHGLHDCFGRGRNRTELGEVPSTYPRAA